MTKQFYLEGLGCAHCASKMERAIGKLSGVSEVSINFLTTKLTIEASEDNMPEIIEKAKKIIKKIEPKTTLKQ